MLGCCILLLLHVPLASCPAPSASHCSWPRAGIWWHQGSQPCLVSPSPHNSAFPEGCNSIGCMLHRQDKGKLAPQHHSSQFTDTLLAQFALFQLLVRLDWGKWGKKKLACITFLSDCSRYSSGAAVVLSDCVFASDCQMLGVWSAPKCGDSERFVFWIM